jgi:hypothetical protein
MPNGDSMGSPNPDHSHTQASVNDAELAMERNSEAMAGNLANYHRWSLGQFPIPQQARLLDLGCGRCLYINEILRYQPMLYVAADYDQGNLDYLNTLFGNRNGFQARHVDLMDTQSMENLGDLDLDYILCFDVLEHLENHHKALQSIKSVMYATRAKALFIKVPAMQSIYGRNDQAIGHHRRYSHQSLKQALDKSGFNTLSMKYQNMPGIIPWFLIGRVLKRSSAVTSEESKLFDRVVPLIQKLEQFIEPPCGLSLNAIVVPA